MRWPFKLLLHLPLQRVFPCTRVKERAANVFIHNNPPGIDSAFANRFCYMLGTPGPTIKIREPGSGLMRSAGAGAGACREQEGDANAGYDPMRYADYSYPWGGEGGGTDTAAAPGWEAYSAGGYSVAGGADEYGVGDGSSTGRSDNTTFAPHSQAAARPSNRVFAMRTEPTPGPGAFLPSFLPSFLTSRACLLPLLNMQV